MIVADIPDLEVYNEKILLEPGYKYKIMNDEIKKYLADTEDKEKINEQECEGIIDEAFSDMVDSKGEKMTLKKLNDQFEEAEEKYIMNEDEIDKAQRSISANLVPLTTNGNDGHAIGERTDEELIKESIENKKKLERDYKNIRQDFRNIMNKLRHNEFETFDKIKSKNLGLFDDPYLKMENEIKQIDQEEQKNRLNGFITSRSEGYDSEEKQDGEDEKRLPLGKSSKMNMSASKTGRRSSLVKKNSAKRTLAFRSSAGFATKKKSQDMTGRSAKKIMRPNSSRRVKMPPAGNKEKLNKLKEIKMNEEKDKIMNEFNKIVSKTATSFKQPAFPNTNRKQVLKPLRTISRESGLVSEGDSSVKALKNITKYSKANMLAAQNEAIASIINHKS